MASLFATAPFKVEPLRSGLCQSTPPAERRPRASAENRTIRMRTIVPRVELGEALGKRAERTLVCFDIGLRSGFAKTRVVTQQTQKSHLGILGSR
jgi:hypothetical protein